MNKVNKAKLETITNAQQELFGKIEKALESNERKEEICKACTRRIRAFTGEVWDTAMQRNSKEAYKVYGKHKALIMSMFTVLREVNIITREEEFDVKWEIDDYLRYVESTI